MRTIGLFTAWLVVCPACTEKRTESPNPPEPASSVTSTSAVASASASAAAAPSAALSAPVATPSRVTAADEARFDAAARGAIERGEVPGAVIVVLRHGKVVFRRAYGHRAKEPAEVSMTVDTVFDLASLTKPIATATSILMLAERGTLRIQDPVQKWLPAFRSDARITIEHLLVHTSGLPAGNAAAERAPTRAAVLIKILETPLENQPGEVYVYSDLGYALLGEIVEKASGEPLDIFAQKNIFDPVGMRDTSFRPAPSSSTHFAPTTRVGDEMLLGKVHDPLARSLSGVAGHAGLFSTADDIARFVSALMAKGDIEGKAVLSPALVRRMFEFRSMPKDKGKRSLALESLFDAQGHTGFTGTAFWIDQVRDTAVIVLTNAVHPDGKGKAKQLRRDVAAAAVLIGS